MTQPDDDEDELRDTGHDVHFLERLERVDLVTTDLALRLYRSPELVRALLADPTCPQGAERVAIAIQPGPSPAHVMVARSGAFVTCLGQGMEVSGTPVISWERLRIHLHRAETRAAQRTRADELLQGGDARALLRRITEAGPNLTREEFQQLLAVEPTLQGQFATEVLDMYAAVFRLAGPVARVKRIGAVEERALRTFWRMFHAAGHLLLLSSLGGRRSFTPWDQIAQRHDVDIYDRFYLKLFRFGYGPTALRSVWAMGCAGKLALPSLKRAISTAERLLGWTAPALGLLAIGLRHQRLRTEIEGVIGPARLPPNLRDMTTATQLTRFLQMMVRGEFVDPARLSEEQDFSLRNFAATALALRAPPDKMSELSLTEFVEFLRDDPLLFTHLANASFTFDRETPGLALLTAGTLALATQPAEQFYYPAEHIHLTPQYTPELVRLLSWFARPAPPVRAQPKAGRNEPCPCGSGKKYKKCCDSG